MKRRTRLIVALGLSAVVAKTVGHPLDVVECEIRKEERDVEFLDVRAPAFHLTDARGRSVRLVDLRGKVVVLNFFDSHRSGAGRAHMALIAKLQAMVNTAAMQDQVRFITVATDEEDVQSTRKVMASYAKTYNLDTRNWQLLYRTSAQPPSTMRQLAQAYGLQSMPAGEGMQMHGVVTHVVDQTGRLRARFHRFKFEPVYLVSYVNALINDDHSKH